MQSDAASASLNNGWLHSFSNEKGKGYEIVTDGADGKMFCLPIYKISEDFDHSWEPSVRHARLTPCRLPDHGYAFH